MADVVAGLAVFGAVIAVGWLLVRTRAVPADADGVLTRVCFFAATPALLVTTLSRADLTAVLSRSTAVAVAAAPGAAGGDAAAEEKDEFDVILEAAGDKKIQVIKEVRALTSLGLKEAKELVDGAPKPVLEGANKEAAEKAKEQLEGAGATVTLK